MVSSGIWDLAIVKAEISHWNWILEVASVYTEQSALRVSSSAFKRTIRALFSVIHHTYLMPFFHILNPFTFLLPYLLTMISTHKSWRCVFLLNYRGRSLIKSRHCNTFQEGSGTVICCLAGVWEASVTKQLFIYINIQLQKKISWY